MKMEKGLRILQWAEEDRPREKLLLKGRTNLTDAELIAILIGSGTRELTAVELSQQILAQHNYDLSQLAKLSVKDLMKFKGIGEAKAISIISALELGRRRKVSEKVEKPKIRTSNDAYEYMKPYLLDETVEHFWIICLDTKCNILQARQVSLGGRNATIVDPKVIFKLALEENATQIILVHNHPSGSAEPSHHDEKLTQNLVASGITLSLHVIDHIVFTDNDYYSFADNGLI